MATIIRPAFRAGERVYHTSDPMGEHGTVQADTHEGQVWVSILWDGAKRPLPYPTELIRRSPSCDVPPSVILSRDFTHAGGETAALDAFYMAVQARYGRRAANAAIEAAEDAITRVVAENAERGVA
jgi:hypothetical protein